jgi:hypothetical protein
MSTRIARMLGIALTILLFTYAPAQSEEDSPAALDALAIASAIPIQGSLRNGQGNLNGPCDLRFALYSAAQGGTQVGTVLTQALTITDSLFNTSVDFGNVWDGSFRWLETAVRCPSGTGNFTVLSPRQLIQATPYALRARLAEDALAASATFTSGGGLRSARPGDGTNAGYLELVNTTSGDTWQLVIRTNPDGQFSFAFYDAAVKTWKEQAILSRDGIFWAKSHIIAGGDLTAQNGLLRSTRQADQYNGGLLELENGTNGNKWQMGASLIIFRASIVQKSRSHSDGSSTKHLPISIFGDYFPGNLVYFR